ncbi:MAG: beta-galactosidase small subunit, partial [Candidatus Omnitrophica bacterium]|nr:beta-galactosidase small subunit [Candidatus Omnitrophota bacterium]
DNDRGRHIGQSQGIWRQANQGATVQAMTANELPNLHAVCVRVTMELPKVKAKWETLYTVYGSGDIVVEPHFLPGRTNLPSLPRLGMQMQLPAGFEHLAWLGRGPQETYADRDDARVAVYSGEVTGQFFADYTKPGESGNKVGVRWAALTNDRGMGLLAVVGMPLLSVNALHYTTGDLQSALHPWEMTRHTTVTLNLDLRQMGVGGDDSWGAWPHPQFLIPCAPQTYRFRLRPFGPSEKPEALARMTF